MSLSVSKPMEQPSTREEFEHNFHLLGNSLNKGELKIAPHVVSVLGGVADVRYLPNKRIDFLSVNESARLMANHLNHMMNNKDIMENNVVDS